MYILYDGLQDGGIFVRAAPIFFAPARSTCRIFSSHLLRSGSRELYPKVGDGVR